MNGGDKIGLGLVLLLLAFVGGCLFGMQGERSTWETECVKRELGYFDAERDFQWVESEKNKPIDDEGTDGTIQK